MMDQTFTPPIEDQPLSPWWHRTVFIVLIVGFVGLLFISGLAYKGAPPVPGKVVNESGDVLFTGDEVRAGQEVFLKYGIMNNGTIWGHGAYLGPDFSATALHEIGKDTASALAESEFGQSFDELSDTEQAGLQGITSKLLKTNRYDPASDTLTLTDAEATAWQKQIQHWTEYFKDSSKNGGLTPNLITDPDELHVFSSFVTWAAWASVTNRPGRDYSYTNNFPYDPSVGNSPIPGAILWSALSLIALLGGTAFMLFISGRYSDIGWITNTRPTNSQFVPGKATPLQRSLVKFFVVVGLLFLMQTLVGGALAHFRTDPTSFYGIALEKVFPSNLMRTWHLQTVIFWIATAYVAAALFIGRSLAKGESRAQIHWINFLFVAFAVVIGGSLLGEWAGIVGWMGDWWFWLGNQGWEYLELGRIWQYLLIIGLLIWFAILWTQARPKNLRDPKNKTLTKVFLFASSAIPVFYLPAVFYGADTNWTVVDLWRFWIVHLWVEGFFEFFATTIVALTFFKLGITRRNVALKVIYMDGILFFLGGMLGTGHHWYFSGQGHVNMAVSAVVSALEVVPLTLLTLEAWEFVRTTRNDNALTDSGERIRVPHKWTLYFLMAVGFWNFVGAGVFGFLINMPIVSYFETGTLLTPNHGHATMMGVFGMLAMALTVFVIRQVSTDKRWSGIEKYVKFSFWGINIGLIMMLTMNLFPGGVLQLWDVVQNGYWHAREFEYIHSARSHFIEWLRFPGDMVFIVFGSLPMCIAVIKAYLGMHADKNDA